MLVALSSLVPYPLSSTGLPGSVTGEFAVWPRGQVLVAGDPEDDEDIAEDDLPLAEPTEEESNFDDFDDEFDDDFEEEENDPDWDHADEGESPPSPAKGPGGKK